MPRTIECEIDLLADLAMILQDRMRARGFAGRSEVGPETVCLRYFNLRKRLIPPRRRRIHKSKEFICPTALVTGLERLIKDIKAGHDLTRYLSKRISDADYDDDMLNDWGVHHLHLGSTPNPKGPVQRTGNLLFALFGESDAYLIGVFDHQSWCDRDIIRILHENWSEVIAGYRIRDFLEVEAPVTDEDVAVLRNAHINALVRIEPGVSYCPLGGGCSISGKAIDAVEEWHAVQRLLRKWESDVARDIPHILSELRRVAGKIPRRPEFHLEVKGRRWVIVENITGLIVFTCGTALLGIPDDFA